MRIVWPLPLLLSLSLVRAAQADSPPPVGAAPDQAQQDPLAQFGWQRQGVGKLGANADIKIPDTFRFLPGNEASRLIEAMGNLSSKKEVGLIGTDDLSWFVVFFFDDIGYVKDDDKDELDANKMAEQMKENLTYSNEERRNRGMEELSFDGWAIPPRYNVETKELEWAHRLASKGGTSVNYNTRVLGRHGVMRVILVTDPAQLDATLPNYRELMKGFRFIEGEDYASYRAGDKIAEYGLVALVAGGAGAVAAKTGLLAAAAAFLKKGAKLVVVAVVAIAAALKKFIAGLFGKKEE